MGPGLNTETGPKIIFPKIGPEQKQAKIGHSMTDEIINYNSKKVSFNVKKKEAVSALKRKSKVVYDLIQKKLRGPLLKEHRGIKNLDNINCNIRNFFATKQGCGAGRKS